VGPLLGHVLLVFIDSDSDFSAIPSFANHPLRHVPISSPRGQVWLLSALRICVSDDMSKLLCWTLRDCSHGPYSCYDGEVDSESTDRADENGFIYFQLHTFLVLISVHSKDRFKGAGSHRK
jgi:hypothetical protein